MVHAPFAQSPPPLVDSMINEPVIQNTARVEKQQRFLLMRRRRALTLANESAGRRSRVSYAICMGQ